MAAVAPAGSLPELVERAWVRSREGAITAARAAELQARDLATQALFAGAPAAGLGVRRDLPRGVRLPGTETVAERGNFELEPGLSAPLWLPGQRDAQRRVLDTERALLSAAAQLQRLGLAGEVREALWAIALARSEQQLQQARLDAASALEADVARRVAAGDLAPADRLLARAEQLAAEAAAHQSRARVDIASAGLRRLTGVDASDVQVEPVAARSELEGHPALQAGREAVQASRARLGLAQATRRDNPTVSVTARFDRETYGAGYSNTIRVGISVPLDTEARNAPRLAAATAQVTEAEIALERRQRDLAVDVERAETALAAAQTALATNSERAATARQAHAAFERAFRAGERGLPELLRIRAQALEADLAHEQARVQLGVATARLNQARGHQP